MLLRKYFIVLLFLVIGNCAHAQISDTLNYVRIQQTDSANYFRFYKWYSGAVMLKLITTDTTVLTLPVSGTLVTQAALDALIPPQTSHAGEYLTTNGTALSWAAVSGSGTVTSVDISGSNGITIGGTHPITTSGTITLDLDSALVWARLGLGTASTKPTSYFEPAITAGTSGQYWRGDKSWQTLNATAAGLGNVTNNLQLTAANNLSDLVSASTARTNLGLGTLATQNGSFSGVSSGTNTGDQTSVTGNAGTATALQTARTINTVSFDGSANIIVTAAAGTLTGTTLNSTVVNSSLTVFGASPTFVTPILGTPTSGTLTNCTFPTLNQNTTGSAGTLSPGRTINGTEFDGSGNITVTADAGTLTGATLASGVIGSSLTSFGASIALGTPASGTLTNCTFPTLNQNTSGSAAKLTTARTIDGVSFDGTANITPNGGWTVVAVSGSNATRTAQTLGDITGLSFAAAASTTYEIEAFLSVSTTAVTTGVKYGVNSTGIGPGPTQGIIYIGPTTVSTGLQTMLTSGTNINATASGVFLTTASETGGVYIHGWVGSGGGSPTISIQHLKVTSGTSTVIIGSFMRYRILGQ